DNHNSATQCTACPKGTASQKEGATSSSTCEACGEGLVASTGSSQCTACPEGTEVVGGVCKCPAGQAQDDSASASASREQAALGLNVTCAACEAGTYAAEPGTVACTPCAPGAFSQGSASTCSPCEEDTYSLDYGSEACQACPANSYTTGSSRLECTCAAEFLCDLSPAPTLPLGRNALACLRPAGTYGGFPAATGIANCTQCAEDAFSNTVGATSCELCPPGALASVDRQRCECMPGYLFAQGACETAPLGYYTLTRDALVSIACEAGTFSNTTAADSINACIDCPANHVAPVGASSCVECPANAEPDSGKAVCTCSEGYEVVTLDPLVCQLSQEKTTSTIYFSLADSLEDVCADYDAYLSDTFLPWFKTRMALTVDVSSDQVDVDVGDLQLTPPCDVRRRHLLDSASLMVPSSYGLAPPCPLTSHRIASGQAQ
ncbi:hypothetical protein CYMTET_56670, partial [Cymbomonas tetramitiformis]